METILSHYKQVYFASLYKLIISVKEENGKVVKLL